MIRSSAIFNRIENISFTKIKYIMYNVQDNDVLYNDAANPAMYEGWHFRYMWETVA